MARRLLLVVIGLGCLATGAQLHLVREFMALFAGNELSLAVLFGCWFLGIVAGATLGARLATRASRALTGLMACSLAMPPALFGLVGLLRSLRILLELPAGQLPPVGALLASGLAIVAPFGALIGLAFPLACRAVSAAGEDPLAIGRVYVLESVGAIAGGLLVGVLLAGWCPPTGSMALVSLPLLAGLAWIGLRERRLRFGLGLAAGLLAAGLAVLGLAGGLAWIEAVTSGWRFDALRTGGQRVAWSDTAYQHLDLAEQGGQYSLYADGRLVVSFPDPYGARPRAHLVLGQHAAPRRVLLLGLGFAGFAQAALSHPIEQLELVELDPGVGALVEPFLSPVDAAALADPRVRSLTTDGRRSLTRSDARFDLIFADSPDPDTASLNRFYTREFFELARTRLTPGGVFATRISSSVGLLGAELADRVAGLQHSLRTVFAEVLVLPGQETFLFASDRPGQLLADPDRLAERHRARQVRDPSFSPLQFSQQVQPGLVADLQAQLQARDQPLQNSDDRPVTYLQSVLAFGRMTGDPAAAVLSWLVELPVWTWFGGLLALAGLAAVFALAARGHPPTAARRAAGLAIATVGALGMALELVLSFAYQSLAGSLYQELGLIVATFMAGLVAGGVWIQRRLRRRPAGPGQLGLALLALSVLAAALPWLQASALLGALPMGLAQAWLLGLVLIVGACTGVAFPLAGQVAVRAGAPLGRAAGGLDAWDHLGAALGALVAGLLLIPLLGRGATCLLLALLAALAGGVNLVVSRWVDLATPGQRSP